MKASLQFILLEESASIENKDRPREFDIAKASRLASVPDVTGDSCMSRDIQGLGLKSELHRGCDKQRRWQMDVNWIATLLESVSGSQSVTNLCGGSREPIL